MLKKAMRAYENGAINFFESCNIDSIKNSLDYLVNLNLITEEQDPRCTKETLITYQAEKDNKAKETINELVKMLAVLKPKPTLRAENTGVLETSNNSVFVPQGTKAKL